MVLDIVAEPLWPNSLEFDPFRSAPILLNKINWISAQVRWTYALSTLQAQRAITWGAVLKYKAIHLPLSNTFWERWFMTLFTKKWKVLSKENKRELQVKLRDLRQEKRITKKSNQNSEYPKNSETVNSPKHQIGYPQCLFLHIPKALKVK